MKYYSHHIGDYRRDTAHLSNSEDLAYRRALEMYYDQEGPFRDLVTNIARRLRVSADDLRTVLQDFFILENDAWHNPRADREIEAYRRMSKGGQAGAAKRWGKKEDSPPMPPLSPGESPPTVPLMPTSNQEPGIDIPFVNKKTSSAPASRRRPARICPEDWMPSVEMVQEMRAEYPGMDLRTETAKMKDHEFGRTITDWNKAWRNWIRKAAEMAPPGRRPQDTVVRPAPTKPQPLTAAEAEAKRKAEHAAWVLQMRNLGENVQ